MKLNDLIAKLVEMQRQGYGDQEVTCLGEDDDADSQVLGVYSVTELGGSKTVIEVSC